MDWAALITWVLTAGGGFVLLVLWLKNGGMQQRSSGKIRPAVILGHFALAATGLVLWIVYLASDSSTVAWIAFALHAGLDWDWQLPAVTVAALALAAAATRRRRT